MSVLAPEHPPTPRLTHHARLRCEQMGVGTKRAKRIVRDPDLTRPAPGRDLSNTTAMLACRDDDPEIAVVYGEVDGEWVIITVLWRAEEVYER